MQVLVYLAGLNEPQKGLVGKRGFRGILKGAVGVEWLLEDLE